MTELDVRTQAARRAFWTDHPLNRAYRAATGRETFSLREFIEFVRRLDAPAFNACMFGARVKVS